MIREKITTKDFRKIANSHEYFVWHFLRENQSTDTINVLYSYFDEIEGKTHPLRQFFNMIPSVPYYESLTQDSFEFLMELNIKQNNWWVPRAGFQPLILGFKKGVKVIDTVDLRCYCIDSMVETVFFLDSDLMLSLGVEKENLK